MVSLTAVFIVFVVFFAFVGALRGWAKEMVVAFSVVLALFLLDLLGRIPLGQIFVSSDNLQAAFMARTSIVILLAIFGYAGPTVAGGMRGKLAREKLQDVMLGTVIGALNAYLVIGTILYYLHEANYPFEGLVTSPEGNITYEALLNWFAPRWLTGLPLYFAVALAFAVVIILFV